MINFWPKDHPHDVKYYSREQVDSIKIHEEFRQLTERVTKLEAKKK